MPISRRGTDFYFFSQLAEDLGMVPIWVINNGIPLYWVNRLTSSQIGSPLCIPFYPFSSILWLLSAGVSHNDEVYTSTVLPFVQASLQPWYFHDIIDWIEQVPSVSLEISKFKVLWIVEFQVCIQSNYRIIHPETDNICLQIQ